MLSGIVLSRFATMIIFDSRRKQLTRESLFVVDGCEDCCRRSRGVTQTAKAIPLALRYLLLPFCAERVAILPSPRFLRRSFSAEMMYF